MPEYRTEQFIGEEAAPLFAHVCVASRIEFWTARGVAVVLTREQFEKMTEWVRRQFASLEKQKPLVH